MTKIVPLSSDFLVCQNKCYEIYSVVVNSLIDRYYIEPSHFRYRVINKLLISNKDLYTDKFILDNTVRGKVYNFLLDLAHILVEYDKSNIISKIIDAKHKRVICINILFKGQYYKLITIHPWRTCIQYETQVYDYDYIGIIEGLMNVFINMLFNKFDILNVQSIKLTTNISKLSKKINNLEFKFKNAFE